MLRKLWDNLKAAEAAGDRKAAYFKQNLRVIAAGGDGTVAWILGTIRQVHSESILRLCLQNPLRGCQHLVIVIRRGGAATGECL